MEQVDVEIVGKKKKEHLLGDRPVFKPLQPGNIHMVLDRRDDKIKDQDL